MDNLSLREEIFNMDIIDTHNHLIHDRLNAQSFWEIAEYFWLGRQLWAAGYPKNASELDEKQRVTEFCKAYQDAKNTIWCRVLYAMMKDLYDITLSDEKSVYAAIEAVKAKSMDDSWVKTVADKTKLKYAVVNNLYKNNEFDGLPGVCITVPRIDEKIQNWITRLSNADAKADELEKISDEIETLISEYHANGFKGIMTTLPRFHESTNVDLHNVQSCGEVPLILHRICKILEEKSMFLQLFLGVENRFTYNPIPVPVNYTQRVIQLYGLFERYNCKFDLVLASEINNSDAMWAANIFSNVQVGAMWWYNYLPITYMESMQYRFDGLPMTKSSILASDARNIEWCYGKAYMVKDLMADFFTKQVSQGKIDKETALQVAHGWLYEAPRLLLF